jgi:hypothetical protein
MPIIAGRASAAHGAGFSRVTVPPYVGPFGTYDSLASVTLSASTNTITFAGIPAGYKHLQIRIMALGDTANSGLMRFNSDTGSNYSWHALSGNGTASSANAGASQTFMIANGFGDGPNSTTFPFVSVIDILNYANTSKYKTGRMLDGQDKNGSGRIAFMSGLWMNTAAVTTITIAPSSGNYTQYSSFALYGVK